MNNVFVTTYKAEGQAAQILKKHFEDVNAARAAAWVFTKSLGAVGYRPGHSGYPTNFMFKQGVPDGWKKIQMCSGNFECSPKTSTKRGKTVAEHLKTFRHKCPTDDDAAKLLGWDIGSWVTDGYKVYSPTVTHVSLPSESFYVRLPRKDDDGWEGRDDLVAVTELDFMLALKAHNDLVPKEKVDEAA